MNVPIRERLKAMLSTLLAVESLEYHDKNLLSGDNKSRSEWRQEEIISMLEILNKYKLDE